MNHTGGQPSVDDLLEVLSNVRRRKLLESLLSDSPPDDATYVVVDADTDLVMHHVHLPKLVDYGLIHWDEETNRVTKGPNFEATEDLLARFADHDEPLERGEV